MSIGCGPEFPNLSNAITKKFEGCESLSAFCLFSALQEGMDLPEESIGRSSALGNTYYCPIRSCEASGREIVAVINGEVVNLPPSTESIGYCSQR